MFGLSKILIAERMKCGAMFLQSASTQLQVVVALPFVIIALASLGAVGLVFLWKRGKTVEAVSLLNSALLVIIILLLWFRFP